MRLAADANVLLSAAVGKAALRVFTSPGVSVVTCAQVLGEVKEYLPVLGKKYALAPELLQSQFHLLAIEVCPSQDYRDFLAEATRKLHHRDPDDVELLALALAQSIPLWTNDHDFDGCGVECLSTAKLLKMLDTPKL